MLINFVEQTIVFHFEPGNNFMSPKFSPDMVIFDISVANMSQNARKWVFGVSDQV